MSLSFHWGRRGGKARGCRGESLTPSASVPPFSIHTLLGYPSLYDSTIHGVRTGWRKGCTSVRDIGIGVYVCVCTRVCTHVCACFSLQQP